MEWQRDHEWNRFLFTTTQRRTLVKRYGFYCSTGEISISTFSSPVNPLIYWRHSRNEYHLAEYLAGYLVLVEFVFNSITMYREYEWVE